MTKRKAKDLRYAVWATAWGPMGALADGDCVSRIVLPHYQANDLRDLLKWEHAGAVEDLDVFSLLVELSRNYFNGKVTDFGSVPCNLPGEGTFSGMVYRACREIPYGRALSYGQLAEKIARPDAARAVATALSKNAIPLVIPCHRVTYSDGRAGGFSAPGGVQQKMRMLSLEKSATGGLGSCEQD